MSPGRVCSHGKRAKNKTKKVKMNTYVSVADSIRYEVGACKNHFGLELFRFSVLSLFFLRYYSLVKYMSRQNYEQKASHKRCGKCGPM